VEKTTAYYRVTAPMLINSGQAAEYYTLKINRLPWTILINGRAITLLLYIIRLFIDDWNTIL